MKIILSRKGFDSAAGKVASAILPSNELCWLPIPENKPHACSKRYSDIKMGDCYLGNLVNDLTRGRIKAETLAHLDPDLNFSSIPRLKNWKPIFGQAGAAEKHLQNQGVKEGDVFVFFGWFRQVEQIAGKYQYVLNAPNLHIIFGWLQIEQRLSVDLLASIPNWALEHPHCKTDKYNRLDSIYISTERVELPNRVINQPGAGMFKKYHPALCLTATGESRSVWQLPSWFHPKDKRSSLSYHSCLSRWSRANDYVLLNTVGRGQEFVLDSEDYPESIDWLCSLLSFNH